MAFYDLYGKAYPSQEAARAAEDHQIAVLRAEQDAIERTWLRKQLERERRFADVDKNPDECIASLERRVALLEKFLK